MRVMRAALAKPPRPFACAERILALADGLAPPTLVMRHRVRELTAGTENLAVTMRGARNGSVDGDSINPQSNDAHWRNANRLAISEPRMRSALSAARAAFVSAA
jgi:hypothetical protein